MRAEAPLAPHLVASRQASEIEGGRRGPLWPPSAFIFTFDHCCSNRFGETGIDVPSFWAKSETRYSSSIQRYWINSGSASHCGPCCCDPIEIGLPAGKEFFIPLAVLGHPAAGQGVEPDADGAEVARAMPQPGPRRRAQALRPGQTRKLVADIVDAHIATSPLCGAAGSASLPQATAHPLPPLAEREAPHALTPCSSPRERGDPVAASSAVRASR